MRKLLAILGVITCMVGLCACGQEETAPSSSSNFDEASLLQYGEATVQQVDMIVSQGTMEQYASDPVIYNGLVDWQNALDDIGNFEGTDGGSVEIGEEEIVISINITGSDHNAVMEIVCPADMSGYEGISTNIEYSTSENMGRAAMNTLIGMGTVFVVLIIISLIISAFGVIPKLEAKLKAKEKQPIPEAKPVPVAAPVAAAEEELSDDTELVAVIAAAIAAYEGSGSTDGFVVRSIRKSKKSKWQNA